ncbi:MAG TPA: WcaF family extracellular polysaccharide biosynthesis acetyltransferase [Tepidisphaeraceae bacterium]|jgi:putative colanic acid biosynthesis acetyltransferase WcaF
MKEFQHHQSAWSTRQKVARVMWMFVQGTLFRWSFHNMYGWRRFLLRQFGATIGHQVRVRPTVRVEIPWNIRLDDGVIIGDFATLYALGKITIGRGTVVSQHSYLCAGTHDYTRSTFDLLTPPIIIGQEAWVAADCFIGPGVILGNRCVIGARSSVFKDIPDDVIAAGHPANILKPRVLDHAQVTIEGQHSA